MTDIDGDQCSHFEGDKKFKKMTGAKTSNKRASTVAYEGQAESQMGTEATCIH